jgi:LacI family transcriptional regulator
VLEACRAVGARVPDDVAVIGVDNDEMICELTSPPMSSIEQGARRMGYEAAALLERLMRGRKTSQLRFVVEPEGVIARRSTDTLAVSDAEVAAAMRFIRDHACQRIHIDDVAEAIGLSRSSAERRFKAVMGRTIHAEINRVRFARAKQLVAESDLPLKQVSFQAGFRHVQYMTAIFRRRLGQTPKEYRTSSRGR